MTRLHIIVWACAACIIVFSILTVLYVNRESNLRRDDLIASCERGNTVRVAVNQLILSHHVEDRTPLIPLVDCSRLIK